MRSADCFLQPQVESAPDSTVEMVSVTWGSVLALGLFISLLLDLRAAFLLASMGIVALHQLFQNYSGVLWHHVSCSDSDVFWVLCIVCSFIIQVLWERDALSHFTRGGCWGVDAAWNPPLPARVHLVSEAQSNSAGLGIEGECSC